MTDQENITTMREDLDKILQGPDKNDRKRYILCALSDLCVLLKTAVKDKGDKQESNFSKHFPDPHFPTVKLDSKSKVKRCVQKINYFLSYTKDCLKF